MLSMEAFLIQNMWTLLLLAAWTLPWKGYALWLAARNSHKWWFVILLVVNTIGILEIFYIFAIGRKNSTLGSKIYKIFKK